jgi:hypothetical protein
LNQSRSTERTTISRDSFAISAIAPALSLMGIRRARPDDHTTRCQSRRASGAKVVNNGPFADQGDAARQAVPNSRPSPHADGSEHRLARRSSVLATEPRTANESLLEAKPRASPRSCPRELDRRPDRACPWAATSTSSIILRRDGVSLMMLSLIPTNASRPGSTWLWCLAPGACATSSCRSRLAPSVPPWAEASSRSAPCT